MKIVNAREERRKGNDISCPHFPYGYVECYYPRFCDRCELGDRIRRDRVTKAKSFPLFTHSDTLRQTDKGGGAMLWHYPIILTERALERLGIDKNVYNQIAVADGGPGVFLKNSAGEIDIHLFTDKEKIFTITRAETYGIPNENAVRRYDEWFFLGLRKYIDSVNAKRGGWSL